MNDLHFLWLAAGFQKIPRKKKHRCYWCHSTLIIFDHPLFEYRLPFSFLPMNTISITSLKTNIEMINWNMPQFINHIVYSDSFWYIKYNKMSQQLLDLLPSSFSSHLLVHLSETAILWLCLLAKKNYHNIIFLKINFLEIFSIHILVFSKWKLKLIHQ